MSRRPASSRAGTQERVAAARDRRGSERPSRLPAVVLWLTIGVFAGFGAAFVIAPARMAGLVDVVLPTPTARIDFVATYGGLELGFAAFLVVCARRPELVGIGLLAAGFCLLGFALARGAGLATAAGEVRPILYGLLLAEAAGAALCFWAAGRAAGAARGPQAPPRSR